MTEGPSRPRAAGTITNMAAALGTLGSLAGAVNWALAFSASPFARAYLVALVALGGGAGVVVGAAIGSGVHLALSFRREGAPLATAGRLRRPRVSRILKRLWAAVVGAGLAALAAYLGSAPRFAGLISDQPRNAASEAAARPNIILISLDTVRPDHLGAYGYARPLTPSFDALAASGTLFRRCVAASSWTIPSHAAIFTGTAPSHIGSSLVARGRGGAVRLPRSATTLSEVFKTAGYHTAAFIGGATLGSVFGFDQGFDVFNDRLPPSLSTTSDRIFLARSVRRLLGASPPQFLRFLDPPFIAVSNFLYAEGQRLPSDLQVSFMKGARRFDNSADEVNRKVFAWLDRRPPRPFFLFVHYFDAHDPYDPPAPYAPPGYDPALGFIIKNGLAERVLNGRGPLTREEHDQLVAAYDGEIAAMDHHFGLLLDRLRAEGVLGNAVVAVVSDHGEAFGEHGLVFHGHHLYDPLTHAVLAFAGRGVAGGRVESEPVSGVDVAPTILDLAGVDRPGTAEGRSLRPLLEGKPVAPVPLIAEVFGKTMNAPDWEVFNHTRFSVEMDGIKMIREVDGPAMLFDLHDDPGESHDLSASRPGDVERLSGILAGYLSRVAKPKGDDAGEAAEEALERLRGLGYIR